MGVLEEKQRILIYVLGCPKCKLANVYMKLMDSTEYITASAIGIPAESFLQFNATTLMEHTKMDERIYLTHLKVYAIDVDEANEIPYWPCISIHVELSICKLLMNKYIQLDDALSATRLTMVALRSGYILQTRA
ncbi:Uncharacterized protein Fot_22689 [Forsythia ovata]|uniref:Glutaredoxin-like protein n=1 Tax=Forsythia ovata TaxID=205694 RepID=A0ABD1V0E4_9LAMI